MGAGRGRDGEGVELHGDRGERMRGKEKDGEGEGEGRKEREGHFRLFSKGSIKGPMEGCAWSNFGCAYSSSPKFFKKFSINDIHPFKASFFTTFFLIFLNTLVTLY